MRSPSSAKASLSIHKFGGAALADGAAIRSAADIVRRRRAANPSAPCLVVASALAGTTDTLMALAGLAAAGDADAVAHGLRSLRSQHLTALRQVREERPRAVEPDTGAPGAPAADGAQRVEQTLTRLERALDEIAGAKLVTPGALDEVLSYGERLSARILAVALRGAGVDARMVDGATVIQTDSRFGNAAPDLARTEHAARERLNPLLAAGIVPVIPGFIGSGRGREIVTLGRGGSDLTATVLARVLGASEVHLWKDVPGLLTADPRVVAGARVVRQLSAREAAELAYYGAKVLHPRALVPLDDRTRVFVRPFAAPDDPGTEISARVPSGGSPVRALAAISDQALVAVTGNGMLGVPGIAGRAFGALAQAGISVSLISQASSEHSICFAVPDGDANMARSRLIEAFSVELSRHEIDRVELRRAVAIVAVVGSGMAHTPGVAARIFTALADASINVVAIAQGSSERNISIVVDEASVGDAQRAIHSAFQLDKRGGGRVGARGGGAAGRHAERVDVVVLGFGRIGRELASHVASSADSKARLRIVGIIDRSGYLFDERGLTDRRLASAALAKRRGRPVAEFPGGIAAPVADALHHMSTHALVRPAVVDVTASDTHVALLSAVASGMDVVLANKVPLTLEHHTTLELLERARAAGRRVLFEATVGAGLPIIDTFDKLVASGDRVLSIEGCPSGTLGYLFGEMGHGVPFSEAVRGAMERGYTEPDPRDDLSGLDVGRKALILARMLGFAGELADVTIEPLVPESLRDIPLADFLARMSEVDAMWDARIGTAREAGSVLRYRAVATRHSVRVGLVTVPPASPLGSLAGTDNQFVFTTKRYRENPLIIIGPGAGPAVTAGGVLNDLLKLADTREVRPGIERVRRPRRKRPAQGAGAAEP